MKNLGKFMKYISCIIHNIHKFILFQQSKSPLVLERTGGDVFGTNNTFLYKLYK